MDSEQNIAQVEDIEGLGDNEDASWGDYPIDTVLIRNENRTVHDILRRIDKGSFVMDPEFQRDFIWSPDKQSKLIESVMMRIPLPVFYLAEDDQGRMVVVDGLQRLSTFESFVKNRLQLKLPDQAELNKKRFDDLSPKLKNRVEDCNLILYIIDVKVPERARLDIFERVNGGVPLTRQQMRNCLLMGPATRFLKTESGTELFLNATGKSLRAAAMRDREFVNRFCAFYFLGVDTYKGDMDDYLAQALRRMNSLESEELADLSIKFRNSLENNYNVFGVHAFRKHTSTGDSRNVLNAALWDVMSIGLLPYDQEVVKSHAELLRNKFYSLMNDDEFNKSITLGTNQVNRVRERFKLTNIALLEVFGDQPY